MSLEEKVNKDLVVAMKAKDEITLRSIRAVKSAILLAKTDGSGQAIDEARQAFRRAVELTANSTERNHLARRMDRLPGAHPSQETH